MDFKNKITEQPSTFDNLEDMSVDDLLHAINSEDAKVHVAVGKAIPQIKILADKILERMASGGRVFYLGAGTSGRLGVLDASELPKITKPKHGRNSKVSEQMKMILSSALPPRERRHIL